MLTPSSRFLFAARFPGAKIYFLFLSGPGTGGLRDFLTMKKLTKLKKALYIQKNVYQYVCNRGAQFLSRQAAKPAKMKRLISWRRPTSATVVSHSFFG